MDYLIPPELDIKAIPEIKKIYKIAYESFLSQWSCLFVFNHLHETSHFINMPREAFEMFSRRFLSLENLERVFFEISGTTNSFIYEIMNSFDKETVENIEFYDQEVKRYADIFRISKYFLEHGLQSLRFFPFVGENLIKFNEGKVYFTDCPLKKFVLEMSSLKIPVEFDFFDFSKAITKKDISDYFYEYKRRNY